MLCLQQRRDATCGTPPFNLNLQVDLEAIFASLYMPFTSPPNSPTQGTCGPPPRRQVAKMGRAPDCPCARKSPPRLINELDGKTVGDVDYETVKDIASAITPVPGGVGSVTTTMMLEAVYEAYHA